MVEPEGTILGSRVEVQKVGEVRCRREFVARGVIRDFGLGWGRIVVGVFATGRAVVAFEEC